MRTNKELMKKQILTIVLTIITVIAANMFFNHLINNGLENLFTIPAYEEGFKMTSSDVMLVNFIKWISILFVIVCGYENLLCNKQLERINKEEKKIMEVITNDNY